MLKMSTVRHASILAIFLCECIDKMNKKVHNKFTNEYRHIQERGSRGICASTEEWGESPQRRNGTVRCMFFPMGARAPVTRVKPGKALRKGRAAIRRRAPSQDIRFQSPIRLSRRSNVQCIKTFAPKFEKTLVLFYCGNRRERTLPFFTV